jgi:hypothetical protein
MLKDILNNYFTFICIFTVIREIEWPSNAFQTKNQKPITFVQYSYRYETSSLRNRRQLDSPNKASIKIVSSIKEEQNNDELKTGKLTNISKVQTIKIVYSREITDFHVPKSSSMKNGSKHYCQQAAYHDPW